MSKTLRDQAITALRRFTETDPSQVEIDLAFDHLRNDPNDRAVALMGASFVDDAIRSAIQSKYRALNRDETARLFSPEAPVGSYGARIKIAYAMDLCSRQDEHDLDCIRAIRNAFAHVAKPLDFKNQLVASVCDHFHAPGNCGPDYARARYLWSVGHFSTMFWATALGFEALDDAH
jgi:proline dehydrogenase